MRRLVPWHQLVREYSTPPGGDYDHLGGETSAPTVTAVKCSRSIPVTLAATPSRGADGAIVDLAFMRMFALAGDGEDRRVVEIHDLAHLRKLVDVHEGTAVLLAPRAESAPRFTAKHFGDLVAAGRRGRPLAAGILLADVAGQRKLSGPAARNRAERLFRANRRIGAIRVDTAGDALGKVEDFTSRNFPVDRLFRSVDGDLTATTGVAAYLLNRDADGMVLLRGHKLDNGSVRLAGDAADLDVSLQVQCAGKSLTLPARRRPDAAAGPQFPARAGGKKILLDTQLESVKDTGKLASSVAKAAAPVPVAGPGLDTLRRLYAIGTGITKTNRAYNSIRSGTHPAAVIFAGPDELYTGAPEAQRPRLQLTAQDVTVVRNLPLSFPAGGAARTPDAAATFESELAVITSRHLVEARRRHKHAATTDPAAAEQAYAATARDVASRARALRSMWYDGGSFPSDLATFTAPAPLAWLA